MRISTRPLLFLHVVDSFFFLWGVSSLLSVQEKLNVWISALLKDQGPNIYRMKGVLAIKGMAKKFVFQGVHMVFDGQPLDVEWGVDEVKENKMIFIGKKLNKEELVASFMACMA